MKTPEQLREEIVGKVINIASGELYDADADYKNIAYFEEKVANYLSTALARYGEGVRREERERKIEEYGFYDLVKIAQTMLTAIYPLDVFDGSSGSTGSVFTSRLHHALQALTPQDISAKTEEV